MAAFSSSSVGSSKALSPDEGWVLIGSEEPLEEGWVGVGEIKPQPSQSAPEENVLEGSVAKRCKGLAARIERDNERAGSLYRSTHHKDYHCGTVSSLEPCGRYERLFFYHLPPAEQRTIRESVASNFITADSPDIDTMLFANKANFRDRVHYDLPKGRLKQLETYIRTQETLSQLRQPDRVSRTFLEKKTKREEKVIQTNVLLDMAIETQTGVLGARWKGMNKYAPVGLLHAKVDSCSLKDREYFYRLPEQEQKQILLNFYNRSPHIKDELRALNITTPEILTERTGGKYKSFESLISLDILFGSSKTFQDVLHECGLREHYTRVIATL